MKKIMLLLTLCFGIVALYSQSPGVYYDYDDAGNRIKRYKCLMSANLEKEDFVDWQTTDVSKESKVDFRDISKYTDISEMLVFPNPSAGVFEIRKNSIAPKAMVRLYDTSGKLVFKREYNDGVFDISNINNGSYILILDNNGEKSSSKIIKIN